MVMYEHVALGRMSEDVSLCIAWYGRTIVLTYRPLVFVA